MNLKELILRLRKASSRKNDALVSIKSRLILNLLGVKPNRQTELQYVELGFYASKILSKKIIYKNQYKKFSKFGNTLEHNFDAKYQIEISNVVVNNANGLVYVSDMDGKLLVLAESSDWPIHNVLLNSEKPPRKVLHEVESATLGLPNSSFAHLIGEDLPTILSVKSRFPFLYYKDSSRINLQIYDSYGLKRIAVPKWVKVQKLLMVTRNGDVGYIHPQSVHLLRGSRRMKNFNSMDKFYVSRLNATRSFPEEITLQSVLVEMGFQVVYPEKMSFEEQRELFSRAHTVAGIHGGGLVNALWSSRCTVIEFMPLKRINRCFEWQSMLLGHDYKRIYIDGANLSKKIIKQQVSSLNLVEKN
jgi:hypothetical protein